MSAATIGFDEATGGVIPVGANINSFHVINNKHITFDSVTGVFTSHDGPGLYEVTWGAAWTADGRANLVLRVDGVEVTPYGIIDTQSDWATESMLVKSHASRPKFAIGNSSSSNAAMILYNNGTPNVTTGFVTIKKIRH